MRDEGFDERDFLPFFGCQPHTPDRVLDPPSGTDRAARRKVCPTCSGKPAREGSKLICAGCHAVAPEVQAEIDRANAKAVATREPERNLLARAVTEKVGGRFILTAVERAELVKEFPDLAPRWLDSIGQSASESAPAAGATPKKPSRRKRREAAARAKVATA